MTHADLSNALQRAGITPVEKTFRELSESNPGTGPKTYATIEGGYCASLRGIDFDKTTELAHPELPLTVKSADVLYANGGVTYLIEFKTGDAPTCDMYRKFYDSCLTLVRLGMLTLDECREQVVGILVRNGVSTKWPHYDLPGSSRPPTAPCYEYNSPADLHLMNPTEDFRILSSYLLKKVYVLTPEDFDDFGRQRGWSNPED